MVVRVRIQLRIELVATVLQVPIGQVTLEPRAVGSRVVRERAVRRHGTQPRNVEVSVRLQDPEVDIRLEPDRGTIPDEEALEGEVALVRVGQGSLARRPIFEKEGPRSPRVEGL